MSVDTDTEDPGVATARHGLESLSDPADVTATEGATAVSAALPSASPLVPMSR